MIFRSFISRLLKAAAISAVTSLPSCTEKSSYKPEPPRRIVLHPQTQRLSSGLESLVLDGFGGSVQSYRRDQVSLAVNNADEPLVLYKASSQPYAGDFSGAYFTNNVWSRRSINVTNPSGGYSSVIFDGQNKPHISFDWWSWDRGEHTGHAKLPGSWSRSWWSYSVLDSNNSVGLDNEINLDKQEHVHVSYYSWFGGRLKYASNANGSWQVEDLSPARWNQTSVTTDDANQAHIAHTTQDSTVEYTTNASGSWQRATIRRGSNPVIRMDNRGLLHVVFQDGGLYHAVNFNNAWNIEQLPATRTLSEGNRLSFAIDRNDKLNALYLSDERDSIYLMTNYSGQWREHLLDNGGGWGHSQIAIDNGDRIHIAGSRGGLVHYLSFHPSQLPPQ